MSYITSGYDMSLKSIFPDWLLEIPKSEFYRVVAEIERNEEDA